jgi:hypothetical protein
MIMTTRCSKSVKTTTQRAVVPRGWMQGTKYPDRQRKPKTKLVIRTFHESIGFEFEEGYFIQPVPELKLCYTTSMFP